MIFDTIKSNAPLLLPSLGYALAWILFRFVFYTACRRYWKKLSAGKAFGKEGLQEKILEESYAIFGSLGAFILGCLALKESDRGGCGLWNTRDCFAGWPEDVGPRGPMIALFHNVELGWYLHYLAKHPLGLGLQDNLAMHLHHASTLVLLLISFSADLFRSGILVLCVLNLSNPFLHVAKVLHYAEAPGDKVGFLLFAVAFFISRIVVYPAVVLKATMWESWRYNKNFVVPGVQRDVYLVANALLGVLMVLQVVWFSGIMRVLVKALGSTKDEFRQESKAQDYTKQTKIE